MHSTRAWIVAVSLTLAARGGASPEAAPEAPSSATPRQTLLVADTTIASTIWLSGTTNAMREATLSTSIMGSVTAVRVTAGQMVSAGAPLVSLDAKDLNARETQANAGVAQAESAVQQARNHATRIRALYTDSAATRVQLEDAESGLVRAEAALRAAQGAAASVSAMRPYADIVAPFDGMVVRRLVDPGSFVAPGSPLLVLQDVSQLRLAVTVAPADAVGIARGSRLSAEIEGQQVTGTVEGIVPAATGSLTQINLLIANPGGHLLAGSIGSVQLPKPTHRGILLPENALVHQGDLTGVHVRRTDGSSELRWLQLARPAGGMVEVLSGLRAGETIELPTAGEQ